MSKLAARKPTQNGHGKAQRDWIAALRDLMNQIRIWSDEEGWATKEYEKELEEEPFGKYTAPVLLVHSPFGRMLVDPVSHEAPGAKGLVDLCAYPGFVIVLLLRQPDGHWQVKSHTPYGKPVPLDKATFLRRARWLFKQN